MIHFLLCLFLFIGAWMALSGRRITCRDGTWWVCQLSIWGAFALGVWR